MTSTHDTDISEMIDEYHTLNEITKIVAAERMGINYSTYKRKTNLHDEYEITVKEIVPFIRAHNMDFRLLDRIEERLGRVAFKNFTHSGKPEITASTASNLAKQQGRSMGILIDALADNVLDEEEKKALRTEYNALAQQVHAILEGLN